ncbi:MAG: hypothetical protein IK065_05305 [Neisseriaceae bacterium]|nr:hypothetical protein [Neisseriaceae bacterium]
MKKLATIAFIIASTITTIANAQTIKPKKEVIFDMGVCIQAQTMEPCMSQHIQILTTGIEWLDKALLLNSGLILDNKGKYLQSSNKSFDELIIQLKQQYEEEFNNFSVVDNDGKEIKQPKKFLTSDTASNENENHHGRFETKFIKQNGDTVIFVTYNTNSGYNGSGVETRREIHFDLKTKKRTHLQGWSTCWKGCNGEWRDLTVDELNGNYDSTNNYDEPNTIKTNELSL